VGVGLVFLVAGGEFLVRGASALAAIFRIPPLVIGLTVVAFGTSMPELVTTIVASVRGQRDLAVGNVLVYIRPPPHLYIHAVSRILNAVSKG